MATQLPSNPEAPTIAYMAMGARDYIQSRIEAAGRGSRVDIFRERHGEQEGIEQIIQYAGLLEAFLQAYKKHPGDNVACFAYEVCQPVGNALAAILDRPDDDDAVLNTRVVLQAIQDAFFDACPSSDLSAIQDAMYDMIMLYVH